MAGYPPPYPPPGPPYGFDPRSQRRFMRDQARAQRAAFRAQRAQMRYQIRGMRRGSILGPIVLIAVGVVFLLVQTGHLAHDRFWDWYGRWWPFLLVAAGLVVLVEWLIDQHLMRDPNRPQYRRTLGGGIFLVLLVCAWSATFFHTGLISFGPDSVARGFHLDQESLDELFGDKHESDQTIDEALNPGSSLWVTNPHGDVTISGTSDDGHIHIAVHKQVYARTDSDAATKAQQFSPTAVNNGSMFNVTVPSLDGARADLVITVPATAATMVTANHGDIHISSIQNSVGATANHGDIDFTGIDGQITAHINNSGSSLSARSVTGMVAIQGHANDVVLTDIVGSVTINGDFFGTTHMEHIAGPIHFHTSRTDLQYGRLDGDTDISSNGISSDQVLGPVVLTTSNRNVMLERIAGDISVTNRNGEVDLTAAPAMGNITIENRSGPVSATLPENSGFQVDARAQHGQVNTSFQLSSNNSGDSHTVTGTVGAGGPTVRIATTNNDISLSQAAVPPIPAVLPAPPKGTPAPSTISAKPTPPRTPHKAKSAATPVANP